MTAVIASSRSPTSTMSRPSTPPAAFSEAVGAYEDSSGQSTTGVSSDFAEAQDTTVCDDFLTTYVNSSESDSFSASLDMQKNIDEMRQGKTEVLMYRPIADLLTDISEAMFNFLDSDLQTQLRERHGVPDGAPGHIVFIDHHTTPPTHFPTDVLCSVKDAPDLVGLYNAGEFQNADGAFRAVPHHRVETMVEAKTVKRGGGRPQATSYIYRHHQARLDHAGVYALVVKPQWYQVLFSDATGVVASVETPWDDLKLLAAYVYSLYCPPSNHILVDNTITWCTGGKPRDLPSWTIQFKANQYTDGTFIFIGSPWGRFTKVLSAQGDDGGEVVVKEQFRHHKRRFKEEDVLEHIHKDGDIPGVVRLRDFEEVMSNGKTITIGDKGNLRTKVRLVFEDLGERLERATSVNQLLRAIYDVLEVHRYLLAERKVLHRDMSIYNILLHKEWPKGKGRRVAKNVPPLIEDVMSGQKRDLEDRVAACLLVDFDHAVLLEQCKATDSDELMFRTGTPTYIARGVCLGRVIANPGSYRGYPMPELEGECLRLYVEAYGRSRYDQFSDKDKGGTCHGGLPPAQDPSAVSSSELPPFFHRPEHDVESVYWSMVAALLTVQPRVASPSEWEQSTFPLVSETWKILNHHEIPNKPDYARDGRGTIMDYNIDDWVQHFPPAMRDVGVLLSNISLHVRSEYAVWQNAEKLLPDHLHEAVQRLIFLYLHNHRDHDIELNPDNPRLKKNTPATKADRQRNLSTTNRSVVGTGTRGTGRQRVSRGSGGTRGTGRKRGGKTSAAAGSRKSTANKPAGRKRILTTLPGPSNRTNSGEAAALVTGPSAATGSRHTGRAPPIVSQPKRKSTSHSGPTSKRMKGDGGVAIATREVEDLSDDDSTA